MFWRKRHDRQQKEGESVSDAWLIVGLGNPGPKYETTRHNVGQMALDVLADRIGARFAAHRTGSRIAEGFLRPGGPKLVLAKSNGYMNTSGGPVSALAKYFGVPPERTVVLHDELDLPFDSLKVKQGGGHGGHNGLRDIHAQLGSSDYWRLRIGIGHPGVKSEVIHWVLKKPAPDQRTLIEDSITHALKAAPALLAGDMDKATQLVHTTKPPRPKPPRPAAAPDGVV